MAQPITGGARYKAAFTFAATNAAGLADDVAYSGGGFALTATNAGDGCAHPITILGNAATNHSAKTFTITGTNANGVAITNSIAGPNGVATVTSTKRFKTVTSVTVDSTTGADTFDIGWTSLASTPWVPLDHHQVHFAVSVAAVVGGTINYDLEKTYDEIDTEASAFVDGTFVGKTASFDMGLTYICKGVRLDVNSHTSGTATFYVLQGDRR